MCLDIKSIFHWGAELIKTAVWQLMMNLRLAEPCNRTGQFSLSVPLRRWPARPLRLPPSDSSTIPMPFPAFSLSQKPASFRPLISHNLPFC